ncbi:MAG: hypothetical protein R2838_24635 [Caldilineaceae bacterium]
MSKHQSRSGLIQLNVNPDSGYVSTENAGGVDGNLWYILGHYLYFQLRGDVDFLARHWPTIDKALVWLEYQDMNECGLLEVPEAADWMDLLAVRYNVLYDNALWYAAKLAHEELARPARRHARVSARCGRGRRPRAHQLAHVDRPLLGGRALRRAPGAAPGHPPGVVHDLPQHGHHLQPTLLPALGRVPRIR